MHTMYLSTTPSPAKPCIRDYSELVTTIIPEPFAKLVPLSELKRRCDEVARTQPRFAEELPIFYDYEVARRESFTAPHIR